MIEFIACCLVVKKSPAVKPGMQNRIINGGCDEYLVYAAVDISVIGL